uniref:Uncharacterized protein n=1 Tax=Cucumis melo TaxID=3656 RepID=A0A9I9EM35_CUCME
MDSVTDDLPHPNTGPHDSHSTPSPSRLQLVRRHIPTAATSRSESAPPNMALTFPSHFSLRRQVHRPKLKGFSQTHFVSTFPIISHKNPFSSFFLPSSWLYILQVSPSLS